MTGILDKFHVEHGIHGTRVIARSNQLTDDLDACAREMKRLLEVNSRGALFEGWAADV
jgi:hypothetical protein